MSTIVAISTPPGIGGIAVVRISGPDALAITGKVWRGRSLSDVASHSAHLGSIVDKNGDVIDRCIATVFRGPRSFTGEDTVEFSLHGSRWIQRKAVDALIEAGAVPAGPGEFTQRAFLNGRLDLAQAEAVSDVIASSSRAAHTLAMRQLDGSFSRKLEDLRQQIISLASLLELELDFSEEEVEFADRKQLQDLTDSTMALVTRLASSYSSGRAFKEGVPVVIAGAPNAGKSTLLNRMVDRDKAIVSDIPGTTRDVIEDTAEIGGILFRFLDTAGLRDTDDTVERIGIDKARNELRNAAIVLWLIDPTTPIHPQLERMAAETEYFPMGAVSSGEEGKARIDSNTTANLMILITKADKEAPNRAELLKALEAKYPGTTILNISATEGEGIDILKDTLARTATAGHNPDSELIITNARHHAALTSAGAALDRVKHALAESLPADLIAQDVREAIHHLGLVTGTITTPDLLTTIFTRFCIGK
ncbi:MAG: tRNA uridine-5-carboxymethylaminomethyl(34) synthesis GTPase MnmE [Muribaculaceae bacterium]|nr:tRNA uridine-5-carboxymethylaminomethyl(34) synthesis GTPase MnmE [Muribaculaceae bacterium]